MKREADSHGLKPGIGSKRRKVQVSDWCWVLLTLVAVAAWVSFFSSSTIVRAELALGQNDVEAARRLAIEALRVNPSSDRALVVAGTASMAMRDVASAQAYFHRVSASDLGLVGIAQRHLGQIALSAGRIVDAEKHLRQALQCAPDDSTTLDQLIYLLMLEGRGWEARGLAYDRLRAGVVSPNYLLIAGRHDRGLETAPQFARHCLEVMPDEPLPQLVLAQQAWRENQSQLAIDRLTQVLNKHPELVEAHTLLGKIVVETGSPDDFKRVADAWPLAVENHPDGWLSRGLAAERSGDDEVATRCYWEALRRNPDLVIGNYRLSQSLVRLNLPSLAKPFADRAALLTALSFEMPSVAANWKVGALSSVVSKLEALGRHLEAAAWCRAHFQETGVELDWARNVEFRLARSASLSVAMSLLDPAQAADFSRYPKSRSRSEASSPSLDSAIEKPPKIAFRDDSAATGLVFNYANGSRQDHLESMIELNGGGIAVLDYDADGWSDLFFSQGGALPPARFDPSNCDQIFRNLGGQGVSTPVELFADVTEQAGLRDVGYGQGATVGDFDNDGFPDLYVGNIGPNQFYRNNGDGTFADVTIETGTQGGGWTSSCVLADLNHDGLPDLYVVRYLDGDAIYQPCDKRVRPRCSPLHYAAATDRIYINLGDGTFEERTGTGGLIDVDGRGLGVVVADFDDSQKLSLFVANDMSANFFFVNRTKRPEFLEFEERGLLSGLAFDHQGQVKASMGVAAGDCNLDGRLDLFVTNFYRESNDLYLQDPDGTFREFSRGAKLHDPSFLMLGWGTQFLDADLDGHQDLIVANGHVHDPNDAEIPYQMPTQVFRNSGRGTFSQIVNEELGEFFQRKRLGRASVRLDWNRDGREDVCLSSLDVPAALLTNDSARVGRFLSIRLVAVNSARDAIGAKVRVLNDASSAAQQLTAGDGFHASNERRLIFGVAEADTFLSVEVDWPSGRRQQFSHLASDHEWILIENRVAYDVSNRPH